VYLSRVLTTLYIGCVLVNSLSHKDLSFNGIRVTCEASCDALQHKTCLFWSAKSLTVWLLGYQFMYQRCRAISSMGALSIHVSCMQSILGNPNPNGPYRLQWLFTCARPERVIHTTCMNFSRDLGHSYIWMITHYYFRGPLTWPINATKLPRSDVDVWCRPLRSRCLRSGQYTRLPRSSYNLFQRRG